MEDWDKAVLNVKSAVRNGHSGAQVKLGYHYGAGRVVEKDEKQAAAFYTQSMKSENVGQVPYGKGLGAHVVFQGAALVHYGD